MPAFLIKVVYFWGSLDFTVAARESGVAVGDHSALTCFKTQL